MHVVELALEDDERRLAARPAHRDRLRRLHDEGTVVMAGPLAGDTGAILVFDLDADAMAAELAADPYYATPGVTVVSVREWQPIIGV
jgi:uncharacterized protein YciI